MRERNLIMTGGMNLKAPAGADEKMRRAFKSNVGGPDLRASVALKQSSASPCPARL
jgi:hypothetical protein